MNNHRTLRVGLLLSFLSLVLLGWFATLETKFLTLPAQWLVVSAAPILAALLLDGSITKFKGFGVEFEAQLKAPVGEIDMVASDAVADIPRDEKQSLSYLSQLSQEKKAAIRWLRFVTRRVDYYTVEGITQYINDLPNLAYFEITDESGNLICVIPAGVFLRNSFDNDDHTDKVLLQGFIYALENGSVLSYFAKVAFTLRVPSSLGLVEVLRKMRSERVPLAAVVTPADRFLGIVFARDIEKRIADAVLKSRKDNA